MSIKKPLQDKTTPLYMYYTSTIYPKHKIFLFLLQFWEKVCTAGFVFFNVQQKILGKTYEHEGYEKYENVKILFIKGF